jgi:hypothetical protein
MQIKHSVIEEKSATYSRLDGSILREFESQREPRNHEQGSRGDGVFSAAFESTTLPLPPQSD